MLKQYFNQNSSDSYQFIDGIKINERILNIFPHLKDLMIGFRSVSSF